MNDVVKVVTYVTDVRNLPEAGKCRTEALAGAPQPVHTFLNINQFAWPGMLVEVDARGLDIVREEQLPCHHVHAGLRPTVGRNLGELV